MTLVEVLIALSILAVLVSMAILRGAALSNRYQLAITTEQIASDLQRARLEAIRRNTPVTFQRAGVTQYQIPGILTRTLQGGVHFDTLAPASVQFSSRGRLVGSPSSFQLRLGDETKQVSVSGGGALAIQ